MSGCTPSKKKPSKAADKHVPARKPVAKCTDAKKCKERREALMKRIKDGTSTIKVEGSAQYKKDTYAALDRLAQTPTGLAMLEDIESSKKTVTIKKPAAGKGNTEAADNWNNGLYDRKKGKAGSGSGSTVKFDPDRKKLNGEKWMTRDPAIGLGHEMIHAYHDAHGTTDGRKEVSYKDADGKKRKAPGYELQTVGLGPYKDHPYTENRLRKEFKDGKISSEHQRPRY